MLNKYIHSVLLIILTTLLATNAKLAFENSDFEIVYLPAVLPIQEAITEDGSSVEEIPIEFSAFGRPISMKLRQNHNLVSANFKANVIDGDEIIALPKRQNCHFLHADSFMIAAINNCQPESITGLMFLDNATFEITPILSENDLNLPHDNLSENNVPHLIKKAKIFEDFHDDTLNLVGGSAFESYKYKTPLKRNKNIKTNSDLTLEVALFFDEVAYKIFAPYMSYNDERLKDMLLAYVNAVQALYKHPSIGKPLDIVLVRMDIMKRQPNRLPHYDGERSKLLSSFCEYQEGINPKNDEDDDHWDMGLYVTGLDLFAYENGRKSDVTMGLAPVGGVCINRYACVLAEFGTNNMFGKPYPSAGFTSVYILAHEIGHNLGMHHDSVGNNCNKESYIMSPSRGTQGKTQWSRCSAEVMSNLGWANCLIDKGKQKNNLDHTSKFMEAPGRVYTARKQCEILLRDKDAYVVSEDNPSTMCYNLRCMTPHRSGYYFSGPALEGTECGNNMHCTGGECITRPKPITIVSGGWGPWKTDECKSDCLEKAKGFQTRTRICNNPIPINTDKGCEGPSIEHILCNDKQVCQSQRLSVIDYASQRCHSFALLLSDLDALGAGLQSPHENDRVWMGCAIFCKRREGSYYTPRIELNDLGIDAYFPDGTWCHNQNGQDYYCNNRHCLPENFKFSKNWLLHDLRNDFPQNAVPNDIVPPELKPYLTLGSDGKPIDLPPDFHLNIPKEHSWEIDDYVLLPDNRINEI